MAPALRILVVDDIDANRTLIARYVKTLGHTADCATNGAEAIEACMRQRPDVVLMDIMMPEMDGFSAAGEIRRLCGDTWLPIIFLSARSSETEQLEGLAVGDDYLTKPINLSMLRARIEVMARIAAMQRRIAEHSARLEHYRSHTENELRFTRHVLDHIAGYQESDVGPVKRWIKPARQLSGDVIANAYSPSGALHVLVADSTGHGLAAAISAVPAVDTFHDMTTRGFSIRAIARELNLKLHRLLPADRFVAAAVVSIDCYRREIQVWNGGIPAAMFITWDGHIAFEWSSRHPPLAILPDNEFDDDTETWRWTDEGELVLCSDGILEAENKDGEPFGRTRFVETLIRHAGDTVHAAVLEAVTAHLANHDNNDDLSIASITCSDALHQPSNKDATAPESRQFTDSNWELHLRFGADEIAQERVRPHLTRWLNQLGLTATQFGELQLILIELCNNAIDHGVLRLDSTLKQRHDGYETYRAIRAERLAALTTGALDITIIRSSEATSRQLQIRVCDTGQGFDYETCMSPGDLTQTSLPHGRGLALVRSLANGLRFGCNGAEAIIDYPL